MKQNNGYTLIEILVSMAIFAALSAITLFGFQGVGRANALRQAADELTVNLRLLQSLSTNGGSVKVCSNKTPLTACTTDTDCNSTTSYCDTVASPPGGYAISVNGDERGYVLFAHMKKLDTTYTLPVYDASRDVLVAPKSVDMADDLTIQIYNGNNSNALNRSVAFTAPRGLPNADVFFCISRPQFPRLHYKVSLISETGQLMQETVTSCTP